MLLKITPKIISRSFRHLMRNTLCTELYHVTSQETGKLIVYIYFIELQYYRKVKVSLKVF